MTAAKGLRWRLQRRLLDRQTRPAWILIELFCRPYVAWRQRFSNAWWQWRHFGDVDAFQALYETYRRSKEAEPDAS